MIIYGLMLQMESKYIQEASMDMQQLYHLIHGCNTLLGVSCVLTTLGVE